MSMNKNLILLAFILVGFFPIIKVEAADNVSRTVEFSCKCSLANGQYNCSPNCTSDIAKDKMQESCGTNGTLDNISFDCGGFHSTDPGRACDRYKNSGGTATPIKVKATATCYPGPKEKVGEHICDDAQSTLRFLGYLLMFIRVLIPFAIIFMGTLDYYKIVISGKDEDMKKQTITLGKRLLAGILIFFIPTFLNLLFTLISNWSAVAAEYETCANCLLTPSKCKE